MIGKIAVLSAFVALSMAQQYGAPQQYGTPQQYGAPLQYTKQEETKYPPQPYNFAYDSKDEYGATQFRKESGDASGRVTGSYGYKDEQGIERIVEYVADENGYRAQVKTNEPGTDSKNPANIELYANPIVVNYIPKPQQRQQTYAAPAQQSYSAPQASYGAPQKNY